ncbi:hypothetical protein BH23ACT9_BH23ACT9_05420 [soil metagenome]
MPKRSRAETPPTFLADRSVGRYIVPDTLRAAGWTVLTLADIWGEQNAQALADVTWLAHAAEQGMPVLTQDDNIRRNAGELQALQVGAVRVFAVTNGQLPGHEVAQLYVTHQHRIFQKCRKPGPFVATVHERGVEWLIRPPKK